LARSPIEDRLHALTTPGLPSSLGQRVGLVGALWVAVGLVLAFGAIGWQVSAGGDLTRVHVTSLLPALALAAVSFGLRTLRWHTFLRAAGVRPRLLTSLRTQLVGFSLTMTPGKVGELYKAYLIERATGAPTAHTAPIVIFEKLMDGLAFTSLAVLTGAMLPDIGDAVSGAARSLLGIGIAAMAVGVIFRLGRPDAIERLLIRLLGSLPFGGRLVGFVSAALTGGSSVLRPALILQNMALSLLARTCDGLAMMWVCVALGAQLPPIAGIFVLNSSGALGGFSMLPGGIGVVEAGMSLILVSFGLAPGLAITATLIARVLSLWMWVAIGLGLLIRSSLTVPELDQQAPNGLTAE
jgi:glycosyltransferase 2 family protein